MRWGPNRTTLKRPLARQAMLTSLAALMAFGVAQADDDRKEDAGYDDPFILAAAIPAPTNSRTAPERPETVDEAPAKAIATTALELAEACRIRLTPEDRTAPRFPLTAPLMFRAQYVGDVSVAVDSDGKGEIDAERVEELLTPLLARSTVDQLKAMRGKEKNLPLEAFCNLPLNLEFDMGAIEVVADTSIANLQAQQLKFGRSAVPEPSSFDKAENLSLGLGAVVSQGVNFDAPGGGTERDPLRADFEGYINFGGFNGASVFYGFDYDEGRPDTFRRNEIQLVKDIYDSAIRITAGDIFPPVTSFQSSESMLGISIAREYRAIQPFRRTIATGRGQLELERNSRVDVYVNGVLSETLDLRSGQYDLSQFPSATGANNVELVIRDDLGRVETETLSFFSDAQLLAPGLLDFGVTAGVPRRQNRTGYDYGDEFLATAFANYGFKDWLTLGLNAQARKDRQQIGTEAAIGTPIGIISLEAVASHAEANNTFFNKDTWGAAFGVGHQINFDMGATAVTLSNSLIARTRDFTSLSSAMGSRQALQFQSNARFSLPDDYNFGVSYGQTDSFDDGEDTKRLTATLSKTFKKFSLTLSANQVNSSTRDDSLNVLAGLNYRFGDRMSARANYASMDQLKSLEIARSARNELDDYGWSARLAENDAGQSADLRAEYINNRFESNLDYRYQESAGFGFGGINRADLRVSSFLGYTDGRVALGRPSPDGFMIASPHKTLGNNKVELLDSSGQRVAARAGMFGPALVPIQRAYFPQVYKASVSGLADGYNIGKGELNILPSRGVGYALDIGSEASRTAMGLLIDNDGEPIPLALGSFAMKDEEPGQFFTNRKGRFVLDELVPGSYTLELEDGRKVTLEVPKKSEGLVDVGTLTAK